MISATIVQGHRVASGLNGNPLFPGGTMRMQLPFFKELGLDLSAFYPGTLNVSITPLCYRVVKPKHTFRALKWHPTEPAEDFYDVAEFFFMNQKFGGELRVGKGEVAQGNKSPDDSNIDFHCFWAV